MNRSPTESSDDSDDIQFVLHSTDSKGKQEIMNRKKREGQRIRCDIKHLINRVKLYIDGSNHDDTDSDNNTYILDKAGPIRNRRVFNYRTQDKVGY